MIRRDRVVNELKEKGLLTESDGAQVVDLSDDNMPPCLILKQRRHHHLCHPRSGGHLLPQGYLPF